MVEMYGSDPGGRVSHPGSISPFARMESTSAHIARVTTSAAIPSFTALAWLPEPPCDWRTRTRLPVFSR